MKISWIFTVEHADFQVPSFLDVKRPKPTHLAFDEGAHELASHLQKTLGGQLFSFPYSRLFIDANRKVERAIPRDLMRTITQEQVALLKRLSTQYRAQVKFALKKALQKNTPVGLISVHSFVPEWKGRLRRTEIGLLCRNLEPREREPVDFVQKHLLHSTDLRVHRNLPYRGYTDCLFNDLMDEFQSSKAFGFFLEINQSLLLQRSNRHRFKHFKTGFSDALIRLSEQRAAKLR